MISTLILLCNVSTYCCLHHLCPLCSHHLNTFKYVDIVFFLQPVQCSVYGNECTSTTSSSTGWKEGACIDQVRLCFVNYGCLYMFVFVTCDNCLFRFVHIQYEGRILCITLRYIVQIFGGHHHTLHYKEHHPHTVN